MAAELDGSGLMNSDVPGLCRQHPMASFEQAINDSAVGLGAAHQEENICLRFADGITDLRLGRFAK